MPLQCGPCLYSAAHASTVRYMPLQCSPCLYSAAHASTVRHTPLQCGTCLYSAARASTVRHTPLQCGRGDIFGPNIFILTGILNCITVYPMYLPLYPIYLCFQTLFVACPASGKKYPVGFAYNYAERDGGRVKHRGSAC